MYLSPGSDAVIRISDEVREALDAGRAVVALETTLIAHGFPAPEGLEALRLPELLLEPLPLRQGAGAVTQIANREVELDVGAADDWDD